jgi:nitroimidazol reductase NimA-like FMN-containing flavoprotein (pyridoxamine 5'-phosphate oxidase superfamily)
VNPGEQPLSPTPRTAVRRMPSRGLYDRETIYAILDEAVTCHVGFVDEGLPCVIPTIHARVGDRLYLHGSPGSRMLRGLAEGPTVCVTVTLVDGLVLARSAFHHSMNYRSVIIFGRATAVTDPPEKLAALNALVEHIVPGRTADVRPPNAKELAGTMVVSLPVHEASAKSRMGPPKDDDEDYGLPVWAGVIPLSLGAGTPLSDPRLQPGIAAPRYVTHYARPKSPPK